MDTYIRNAILLGHNQPTKDEVTLSPSQLRLMELILSIMSYPKYKGLSRLNVVLITACVSRVWSRWYASDEPFSTIKSMDVSFITGTIQLIKDYLYGLIPDGYHSYAFRKSINTAYKILMNKKFLDDSSVEIIRQTIDIETLDTVLFQTSFQSVEDAISIAEKYNFRVPSINRDWCEKTYHMILTYIPSIIPGEYGMYTTTIFMTAFVSVCTTFIGVEDYMNLKRKCFVQGGTPKKQRKL